MRRAVVRDPLLGGEPGSKVHDDEFDEESGGDTNDGTACPTLRRSYRANPRQYHIGACCGMCFVVFLVVIFCGSGLAVLLGGAVVQSSIDGTGMAISAMHVRGMTANRFYADLNLTVDNRSPLGASMEAATLDLTYNGEAVGSMDMPGLALGAAASTDFALPGVVVNVSPEQQDAFGRFGAALINSKTLKLGTRGRITVNAAALSFSPKLDKQIELNGVAGFADPPPRVLSQHIVNASADRIVLSMDVQMTNPSTASFDDAGALSFEIMGEDPLTHSLASLGSATAVNPHNAMLPGVNNYSFTATMERRTAGKDKNEAAFLKVLSDFAAGTTCTVTMKGSDASTSFDLLKPALSAVDLAVSFNGLATLKVPDRRFTSNPVANANSVIDPTDPTAALVPSDKRAFTDLSAASTTRPTCDAPSVMANSWARVAIYPLISSQVNVSCPVLTYTEDGTGAGQMRATPFCPAERCTGGSVPGSLALCKGRTEEKCREPIAPGNNCTWNVDQKSTGNSDASQGPIAGAYMVSYVMVENPTPLPIELHKLDAELWLLGDPNPPVGFELFKESQPLARAIDYPGKVSPVPHVDGTVGTRISPSPLLTVPAHGRAMYQITACVTSCVGFLTGTGGGNATVGHPNPDTLGHPGWLGSSLDNTAPTFAKSYLNTRFYPEVAVADWFNEERGPMSAGISMTGKTTLSMGNLTNLELDLKQPYLPMTLFTAAM